MNMPDIHDVVAVTVFSGGNDDRRCRAVIKRWTSSIIGILRVQMKMLDAAAIKKDIVIARERFVGLLGRQSRNSIFRGN